MRLKQIKLSGFKSFVDLTKVPFEHEMTAIVGPNGCGKSNIIDAVRWVLGESSAKNLRGDAMTDVIFNGANSRKPVGQASVELFFENTKGRIQGNMADRNEISIRRVVNRESSNQYYLNGSKCRRKDITDIFLGTGLGPRSYAIIEQGTISRLIESKPQELRVFIEEAAGISKYKERRRETENRIRHTRENLERLADIQHELSNQLEKLYGQAESAKHFKKLKSQERQYKAELEAHRWQTHDHKVQELQAQYDKLQTQISDWQFQIEKFGVDKFLIKQQLDVEGDNVEVLQQQKINCTGDVAGKEQKVKHLTSQKIALKDSHKSISAQLTGQLSERAIKVAELDKLNDAFEKLAPLKQQYEQESQNVKLKISELQLSLNELQHQREQSFQLVTNVMSQQSEIKSKLSIQKNKVEQSQMLYQQVTQQMNNLEDANNLNAQTAKYQQIQKNLDIKYHQLISDHEQLVAELEEKNIAYHQCQQSIAIVRGQLTADKQQVTQLQQQIAQSDWNHQQSKWLSSKSISSKGSLYQHLQIATKWQTAVESMLSFWLRAEIVEHLPNKFNEASVSDDTDSIENLCLITNSNSAKADIQKGTLAELFDENIALIPGLNKIYLADDFAQAQQRLLSLAQDESIICPDCTWLGHNFIRKGKFFITENLLELQAQLKSLELSIASQQQTVLEHEKLHSELELARTQYLEKLKQNKAQQQHTQQELQQNQQQLIAAQHALSVDIELRESLAIKIEQSAQTLAQETKILTELELTYNELPTSSDTQQKVDKLAIEITKGQEQLHQLQAELALLQERRYETSIELEQCKNRCQLHQEAIAAHDKLYSELEHKHKTAETELQNVEVLLNNEEASLKASLEQLAKAEISFEKLAQKQAQAHQKLKDIEQDIKQKNDSIELVKSKANQILIDIESHKLRAQTAQEQLLSMNQSLEHVLQNTQEQVKESQWQSKIARISAEIANLGPINLAAIEEFEAQNERKLFLEQQHNDLTEAIITLESVIGKIDKESRFKFKSTFEQINNDVKQLFPKVFGGGTAYLELTGDDMLETGVTIMARPPGKKNSTIHLLSGGEKALTALSLVFAIFRLNPAPFCMLDEVDAPLDDANVGRFCNLVREMSQTVQFIYISHNKIAMEMASTLTGVTMFEPGVSRMVAVDIDEAIAMAEVS